MHSSRNPSPDPPTSSGRAIPTRPASASAAHVASGYAAPVASNAFRASFPSWSPRIWPARSLTACCSSLNEKSMSVGVPLAVGPGQAQAEHGDQVPLHLVHPATEGEDDQAAVVALQA